MKLMNKKMYAGAVLVLLGMWPLASFAGDFVTKEDNAMTTKDVSDDLYIAGNSVTVEHNVQEDLFSAANDVEITGNVDQDVYAAGNSVRITGEVGDDVFAAGNTVRITSERVDDVFAAGSVVEVISKNILGSVHVAGQKLTISGQINGAVRAAGETVTIKSGTKINGDLVTYGSKEPTVEDNVVINGERRHEMEPTKKGVGAAATGKGLILAWVMSVMIWGIVALVGWYMWPALINDTVRNVLQKGGRSLGIGFIWMIALVPVVVVLLVTIIGWPLAVLSVLGSMTACIAAKAVSTIVVGVWVMQRIQKRETSITWQHVLVGTVVLKAVEIIPLIGWLIGLVVFMLTLGALGSSLWARLRAKSPELMTNIDVSSVR